MKNLLAVLVFIISVPLHAQQVVVDTMAAMRALPPPATKGYEVQLRGYYRLGDNATQTYRWDGGSSASPDGGAVVAPSPAPSTGRWLLVWDGVTANVRSWGAIAVPSVYTATAADDSLAAVNNAIKALAIYVPNDQTQSPGAGGSGHTRIGQLYFPTGQYVVSGEILVSAYMRVFGDGSPYSVVGFLPNIAKSASNPLWVIRYLYNNQSNLCPNENFYTGVWGISVVGSTSGNAGSCGIYYVGSNGGYMLDCTAEGTLQPFKVDAKGVYLDRLATGGGCRGPGLELTGTGGAEITTGYLDIEHVNSGSTTLFDPVSKLPYPAVWIHDLNGFSVGGIATESSPLSVWMHNCFGGIIQNLHANPNPGANPPDGSALVRIDGQGDDLAVASMSQSPTAILTGIVDNSIPIDGAGIPRAVLYNPAFGRGSYYQKVNAYSAIFTKMTASNVTATTFYGSGAGLTDIPASQITGITAASFQSQPTIKKSANYTLQDSDRGTRQVYNSATPMQLTLGAPSGTAFVNGWYFLASNTGIVPMTLQAPQGCTIDGQTSISLPPRTQAVITSDGTNYFSSLAASGGERLVDFYELDQDAPSVSFTVPPGFHHLHLLSDCKGSSSQSVLVAQVNGDAVVSHYVRNYIYTMSGTVYSGQETSNPGLCVGLLNDPSAPFSAQNDTAISLGSTTPNASKAVSAVTASSAYIGQPVLINNAAQWMAPTRIGSLSSAASSSSLPIKIGARTGMVVTSLTLLSVTGNIAAGSTFYLYGY